MLETERRDEQLTCSCGHVFRADLLRIIDLASHPELLDSLLDERLNLVCCPACGREFAAEQPVHIHDPRAECYACCYPPAWQEREIELRIAFYRELQQLDRPVPAYVRAAEFAFGPQACARALGRRPPPSPWPGGRLGGVDGGRPDAGETDRPAAGGSEPVAGGPATGGLPAADGGPVVQELEESDFEHIEDTRRQQRRHAALVRRWQESGQTHYTFLDQGALHIFQLETQPADFGERCDLLFQLHRIENFPLIVLLLVGEDRSGADRVHYWLFNLDNRIDVRFLEQLAERFEVRLHLFDRGYRRRDELVFNQPLEQNVAYVLEAARRWLKRIAPGRRNFFIAASKFDVTAYRMLGSSTMPLQVEAFEELPTPGVTRLTLDILTWWSSRDEYEYLIFIKSFPVARFQAIVKAVLRRALHFGLAMTEKMRRMAVELGLAPTNAALVERQLYQAVQVARGALPNDLEPRAQADNWRRLLADADALGVAVAAEIQQLAAEALQAQEHAVEAIALDLSDDWEELRDLEQLDVAELIDVLTDPEQREAALAALSADDEDALAGLLLGAVAAGQRGRWREAARVLEAMEHLPAERVLELSRDADPAVRKRLVMVMATRSEAPIRRRLVEMAEIEIDDAVRRAAQRARDAVVG